MISLIPDKKIFANLARGLAAAIGAAVMISTPHAQSFSSGSDGSDGLLSVPANSGTIIFDPRDTSRWGRVLDADGDGVYNFTDIGINSGSTLKFLGDRVNKPIYWLASGNIAISSGATLDLNGASPSVTTDVSLRRFASVPGSGGYAGGIGGTNSFPRTAGEGPGGGSGGTGNCGSQLILACGNAGTFTGNRYLIPLVGGSGGEGSISTTNESFGGGSGGGAILLASSVNITMSGSVLANGGTGALNSAGSGSGGAIRLVAPTIGGGGTLAVNGGTGNRPAGPGWVRLEGVSISTALGVQPSSAVVTRGTPIDQTGLRPTGSLRVSAIDGVPVPLLPGGSLTLPDVSINKLTPVNVDIEAHGIPPGTLVTVQIFSQTPTDINTVYVTAQVALAGTLQSSTATAQFTFPYGFSRGYVRASWTQ